MPGNWKEYRAFALFGKRFYGYWNLLAIPMKHRMLTQCFSGDRSIKHKAKHRSYRRVPLLKIRIFHLRQPSNKGMTKVLCKPATILGLQDRKSTRLNSSHVAISYAVFCL